jgi:carbamoyl-phosphate synthase large subunit
MKTVLITGIGGEISQGVATIIKQYDSEIRLIGTDITLRHGGYLYVEKFYQVPPSDSPMYIKELKNIIATESVDVMIPMSESELSNLSGHLNELSNIKYIYAGDKVVTAGTDKLLTMKLIEELGLPIPKTFSASEMMPSEFPYILKDRFGSGSRNIHVVKNISEAKYLSTKYPDSIFQELLEPDDKEITCAVYRKKDGEVACLQMLRQLMGGGTGWAEIIYDESVNDMCERIAIGLDLYGSMNIQLRLTEEGPRVFEINPRFSSTVYMRHLLGFTDVVWALDEALGKNVVYPHIPEGKTVVRTLSAAVF